MTLSLPPGDFLALSARCGRDPLQVQGPGGNTSVKVGSAMWIKASGTELADAQDRPIFVAVDRALALAEAGGAGDGTCRATVLEPGGPLRPSIETTFHALLDHRVVVHTHSVATLAHVTSDAGVAAALERLAGLPVAAVPYRKPGLPLTRAIAEANAPGTQVFLLRNHGLIVAADTVGAADALRGEVEHRLSRDLPVPPVLPAPSAPAPASHGWHLPATALATDARLRSLALAGSYYPDHVVFLGPALPLRPVATSPALLVPVQGVALRNGVRRSAAAMLTCLADVLGRVAPEWQPCPIPREAEAELLDWDAEKYRQALAAGS
jgi:rhamnose utilization protein RhaD (predicted bifunctional aldolase and dehydrogenase)